jgi:adenylate cyclase class 2
MSCSDTELEVKFYLSRRKEMEEKLDDLGQVIAPRVHEVNLRLDNLHEALTASGRLLRLRQDTKARVTYKGPGSIEGGARLRQELEFSVSDFEAAQKLFEALGYQVYMMYEKYRTTYQLGNVEVVLDEMPYGDFVEIEATDGESIQGAARQLGLNWEARILESYTILFERAKLQLGFDFRDLSFKNFLGMTVTPGAMGVMPADQG